MQTATRFIELEMRTHDLPALSDFYREELSATVLAEDPAALTFQIGSTRITFLQTDDGTRPSYHVAFNISENKIEDALTWIQQRTDVLPHSQTGASIVDWPAWNAHSIYFLDPAGNVLELIARHDLINRSSGPFVPGDLLGVSEIGLVVPDPHATMDLLIGTFDLPTKSVLPDFGAVGDDSGLFIVSAIDRPWMPTTDLPARPAPATMTALLPHAGRLGITDVAGGELYRITGLAG